MKLIQFVRWLAVGASVGCLHTRSLPSSPALSSSQSMTSTALYRAYEDGARIYIEADLGDGVPRFFLVDTGASVTTLSQDVADELGLETAERGNWLRGLAGAVRWKEGVLDTVQIGDFAIENVVVAVDVPGVPTAAGAVPIAGLMGNNVWGQFALAIDYPAGIMELHHPGTLNMPETSQTITFNGQHIIAPATLAITQGDAPPQQHELFFTVDTGASGLLLSGGSVQGLSAAATTGVELIYGVGRGDDLPASNFLQETRRLPVEAVEIGGVSVEESFTATWIEDSQRMGSLLGHHVLDKHRVLIDYEGQKLALVPSAHPAMQPNLHDRYGQWLAKRRNGAAHPLERVEVLVYQEDHERAADLLRQHLRSTPGDAQGTIMLAQLIRFQGQPTQAIETLQQLPIEDLVEYGAIVSLVNALWLEDRLPEAIELANTAITAFPEDALAWLAHADAQRAAGELNAARAALKRANTIDQNPDGHLLRRAWIASEEGDHFAAITHIRRLVDLYPNGAVAPWFYALLVQDSEHTDLFLRDVGNARDRLHPGDGPLDFYAGAYAVVGESTLANSLRDEGLERDCVQMSNADSRRNCEAWYQALTRASLDESLEQAQTAVNNHPNRPDYLDTLAVVQEACGNVEAARDAAWRAASLDPGDVYFLWQADRLNRATDGT